ncbi:hypothetical protein J7T55_012701 [Diaporthe amygdali]|uniref:uncharacterized protein n=1 Tax=Phomopsis amygdali TaxID=1214568 RepID=UPI0022FF13FC|nr:uncharacterized protein J7T55_012701 [Diaporthe amygdali]KAJ0115422.1 hypothetical protein J7T55_012701 [Diaporthe amygdali]
MHRDRVSRVFRLPFRICTTLHSPRGNLLCLLALNPEPPLLPRHSRMASMPRCLDAIAMASGVPLGCCPSRSQPWSTKSLRPHTCAVTTASRPICLVNRLPPQLHATVLHRIPTSLPSTYRQSQASCRAPPRSHKGVIGFEASYLHTHLEAAYTDATPCDSGPYEGIHESSVDQKIVYVLPDIVRTAE